MGWRDSGEEEVEEEDELGKKSLFIIIIIIIIIYISDKKDKNCSQKYGHKKGMTSGSGNYFGKVGSYEKR